MVSLGIRYMIIQYQTGLCYAHDQWQRLHCEKWIWFVLGNLTIGVLNMFEWSLLIQM